jgi:hypothetical protein
MIYIEKNTINNIVLTLTENSQLASPFFLFKFVNEYNLNATPIWWTTPDISNFTNRYNQFVLVENGTGSTTGGISTALSLVGGQWTYTVYESTTQTLDVALTTGRIIEIGRMVVSNVLFDSDPTNDSVYI